MNTLSTPDARLLLERLAARAVSPIPRLLQTVEQGQSQRDTALVTIGRTIRDLDQFLPDLNTAGLLDSPEMAPVVANIWAPDGRATFEYGEPIRPGERHVIWRRIGGHEILDDP
jgi:hypothetical protein